MGPTSDLFTAIHGAIEKLEKQAIKVRAKWRDTKRTPRKEDGGGRACPNPLPSRSEAGTGSAMINRINHHERRKP